MKPKFGVVVFPGSNCDHDAYYAVSKIMGFDAEFLWHKDSDLKNSDVIILPGGFSYGDYLRSGAISRFSPIMKSVIKFANDGGIVIGICNGFQILVEAGLLPGALLKNSHIKFSSKDVYLKVINKQTIFTSNIDKSIIRVPIAHGDGNYFIGDEGYQDLVNNNQIVFEYSSPEGEVANEYNPNGSVHSIAGIINKNKNVLGMMPHPERCCDPNLRNTDGQGLFASVANNFINNLVE